MPKKSHKQKQKQSQNVKQTVIIRLDKEGNRIKRRRKRIPKQSTEGESTLYRSLPAPVVYQSSYAIPYPVFKEPPKVATVAAEPKAKPFIEDIGQVGTEGAVTILPQPTKKEQLGEMFAPVNREKDLGNQFAESESMAKAAKQYWEKKQEEFNNPQKPINNVEKELMGLNNILKNAAKGSEMPITPQAAPRTRRNKDQMAEARQMEREDIASINLGLSQFNPLFTSQAIHEGMPTVTESKPLPSETSGYASSFTQPQIYEGLPTERKIGAAPNAAKLPKETLTETQSVSTGITTIPTESGLLSEQNIPESVLKTRKHHSGSWAYLCLQYKQITGQSISEYKAKKQYGSKDAFAEYIDQLNRQK